MRCSPVAIPIHLVASLLALGLGACGGDATAAPTHDDANPPDVQATAGEAAFCDAAMALGAPGEPEIDWENATEEEIAAAEQVFAEERLRPVVSDVRASGPQQIAEHVRALERILDDGDLEDFFGGEGGDARNAIADEAAERCGWASVDVTMVDYGFEGVPDTVEAGQVTFSVTNDGDEGHEMVVFRRADRVEEDWQAILELDEGEAMERIEFVTAAFAPSEEEASASAQLRPGEYAMICFLPVGTDASGMEESDGPPHFTEGMITTFAVR